MKPWANRAKATTKCLSKRTPRRFGSCQKKTFQKVTMPAASHQSSTDKAYEKDIGESATYASYKRSPYLSIKHSSYFQVYDELFEKYRGQPITFVEVGVLHGGSLFMWRDYFGPQARIIGLDFNPYAKRWEADGFEIHIGDQSSPSFWEDTFKKIGDVDIVLDDGGHTFEQQIVTSHQCIPHIKDGGLLVVEDTHTSYFMSFGYPTKYSFIEWAKKLADNINSRYPSVKSSMPPYKKAVYSISFFESIVGFKIDRKKCFNCAPTTNGGIESHVEDFRYKGATMEKIIAVEEALKARWDFIERNTLLRKIKNRVINEYRRSVSRSGFIKLKRYFST